MSIMDHSHALNDDDDEETALRMAVKYAVWKICSASSGGGTNSVLRINNNDGNADDAGIDRDNGMLDEPPLDNTNIPSSRLTPQALAVLSELTFQYAVSCLAPDLDAFSTHAGRRQRIVLADVLLAVRKKESVQRRVSDAVENATASATKPTKAPSTSRRSAATKSAATSKPAKESDYDDSSSEGDLAARLRGQPPYAPMTKKIDRNNGSSSSSSSSSSEIESDQRWAKKVKHQSSSKLASTNQRRPQQTKARFRLPSLANDNQNRNPNAAAAAAAKWSDSDDSSRSSSLCDHGGAAAQTTTNTTTTRANNTASCTTTTTQSHVESIVANLSLNSLPSDVDNGNHDGF
jgi:CENP-S protein